MWFNNPDTNNWFLAASLSIQQSVRLKAFIDFMPGLSGTEGGRTRVTYFAEKVVFFKTSACPRFVKDGSQFVPKYEVWGKGGGVKIPIQSTKYPRL